MADLLFPLSDGPLSTVRVLQIFLFDCAGMIQCSSDEQSLLRKSLSEKENYHQIEGRSLSGHRISIHGSRTFPLKT